MLQIIMASQYLDSIPAAIRTRYYIELVQNILENNLDKSLDPSFILCMQDSFCTTGSIMDTQVPSTLCKYISR